MSFVYKGTIPEEAIQTYVEGFFEINRHYPLKFEQILISSQRNRSNEQNNNHKPTPPSSWKPQDGWQVYVLSFI